METRDVDMLHSGATVSVVVGTYNGERYLRSQLDSVVSQTFSPVEVLISDDGSTDRTIAIAESYQGNAIPFHIHRNEENLGFGDNFLAAVERATGEYVAFCDQDDIWYPQKLAVQMAVLQRTGASASTHDTDYIDEAGTIIPTRGSRTGRRTRVLRESQMEPWGNFLGNTLVIQRALLMSVPRAERGAGPVLNEHLISHDRWAFALASMANGIALIPDTLSAYRQHSQQLYGAALIKLERTKVLDKQRSAYDDAVRLSELARFRLSLVDRGAPTRNPDASRRRWRSVVRQHCRSADLYRSGSFQRFPRFVAKVICGDYLPARFGGQGHRAALQDATIVVRAAPLSLREDSRPDGSGGGTRSSET